MKRLRVMLDTSTEIAMMPDVLVSQATLHRVLSVNDKDFRYGIGTTGSVDFNDMKSYIESAKALMESRLVCGEGAAVKCLLILLEEGQEQNFAIKWKVA